MANGFRSRTSFVNGLVEDNPLSSGATTLTSADLAALPLIDTVNYAALILDPDGVAGAPEVVYVTAHTAAATTATIARGKEGTTARQHVANTPWTHAPTALDFLSSPDTPPGAPTANDDEFDAKNASGVTGWTTFGAGITADENNTARSKAWVKRTNQGTDSFGGIIRAVGASIPYTVTAHLSDCNFPSSNVWPVLFVCDSSTGAGAAAFIGLFGGQPRDGTCTNLGTFAGFGNSTQSGLTNQSEAYFRLEVTAANNIATWYSHNGHVWRRLHSGLAVLSTAGYVGFALDAFNADIETAWDWIRFS